MAPAALSCPMTCKAQCQTWDRAAKLAVSLVLNYVDVPRISGLTQSAVLAEGGQPAGRCIVTRCRLGGASWAVVPQARRSWAALWLVGWLAAGLESAHSMQFRVACLLFRLAVLRLTSPGLKIISLMFLNICLSRCEHYRICNAHLET